MKRVITAFMAVTYIAAGAIMMRRGDDTWAAIQFVLAWFNIAAIAT